ncbi:MAG TPA: methyltransferase domain-containing protein [Gemmataceae bacterium]|nr:methyltransferase domain-containing protein [Gemmataceae bacterium]
MHLSDAQIREKIGSVRVWYHKIPLRPGIVTPGTCDPAGTLPFLDLPADCRGLRALDLGTRDGYFAFELERRGAEVLAVDYMPRGETGFNVVAEVLGSRVEYLQENIYNLTPEKIGTFDVVLFLGLLYHLPDPVQALKIVRGLCHDRMCLETHAIDNAVLLLDGTAVPLRELSPLLPEIPLMQFYPGRSLVDDPTNYWGPNLKCLEGMLRECKFAVRSHTLYGNRAVLNCRTAEDPELDYLHAIARGLRPKA